MIETLKTAKSVFDVAKARIGSFDDGAKFYMEKQDFPVALFMLHQVCELNCRALEVALFGKEKRSHQLSEHRKFITALLPDFNLLPEDHNNDMGRNLLNLFDKCYSSVRYENGFAVEGADIQLAYDIASRLNRSVDLIFESFLSRLTSISKVPELIEQAKPTLEIDTVLIRSQTQEDKNYEEEVLDTILEIIKEHLMPEAVYLFGKHSQNFSGASISLNQSEIALQQLRFEILVISDVQNPYGLSFKNRFRQKFGTDVSVLLLIHGKKEFYRSVSLENGFFNLVIRSGKVLFGDAPDLETVDNDEIVQGDICSEINLMNRNSRAKELWECSGQVLDEGSMVLAASLMCQAVEQSCLGLIQKFLCYRPNMHRLGHLLDICSVFWADIIQHYFPKSIEMDKRTFSMLSNGQSLARHNDGEIPAHNEIWGIYRRAGAFIDAAKLLTEGKKSDDN